MYQPYRGQRDQRQKTIRNIIIAVLCLFIAGCTVFLLYFQDTFRAWEKKYMLEHSQQQTVKAETKPSAAKTQPAAADKSTQQAAKPTTATAGKTLELSVIKLDDPAYLQKVIALYQQGEINAAAIPVKDAAGQLTYPSAIADLKGTDALKSADAGVVNAVKALKTAGVHMTAILYTYQDNLYPRHNTKAELKTKTHKAWVHNGKRVMDPGSDAAFAYIQALVQECGTTGFDEVVLKGFGWPTTGSLQRIDYGTNTDAAARAAVLAKQVTTLTSAVPTVQISVWLDEPQAASGQSKSGQSLAALYPAAAHIYVPLTTETATSGKEMLTQLSSQTGGQTTKLVPVFTSKDLAPTLLRAADAMYFDTSATKGEIDAYVTAAK